MGNKPVWAIVGAQNLNASGDPYSDILYHLTFNGHTAGNLRVEYLGNGACNTQIQFVPAHEGNDGAYITCLALKALYDNQVTARESTGCSEDFDFPIEAFEFVGSYVEFTY